MPALPSKNWESGRRFGNYVVVRKDGLDSLKKNLYLICKCDCGSERRVSASALKTGAAKSCGCIKIVPMVGRRFGSMVVTAFLGTVNKRRMFECACDCGSKTSVRGPDLRRGAQVSCGCHKSALTAERNKKNATHGMTHTGVYNSWFAMRDRCEKPTSPSWQWYGAKGVRVCDQWQDFKTFFADMGHRPEGCTLDRINPAGNYEPGNCRWATYKEQAANKRRPS